MTCPNSLAIDSYWFGDSLLRATDGYLVDVLTLNFSR
jgi:hypothetical protein